MGKKEFCWGREERKEADIDQKVLVSKVVRKINKTLATVNFRNIAAAFSSRLASSGKKEPRCWEGENIWEGKDPRAEKG